MPDPHRAIRDALADAAFYRLQLRRLERGPHNPWNGWGARQTRSHMSYHLARAGEIRRAIHHSLQGAP